jgi:hypothetical protein
MTNAGVRRVGARALAPLLAAVACQAPPAASPASVPAETARAVAPAPVSPLPTPPSFDWSHLARLKDARGGATPDALAGAQAAVVAFVGTECPLTTAYIPKLNALHDAYAKRGVAFFAVYSNAQDGAREVAAHAAKLDVRFAAAKDAHNELADELRASTTPEVFVVSPRGETLYHGQIDDQFGIGVHKLAAKEWYLARALDDVLSGRAVAVPETTPQGCSLSRERRTEAATAPGAVTYARDVAPILRKHCQACHAPGQIGPMPLVTYEDAAAWSGTIRARVAARQMPPWGADGPPGVFSNDVRLSDDEYRVVLDWADHGAARGDARDAESPAPTQPDAAPAFAADTVVAMEHEFEVPATGVLDYQYFWTGQTFDHDVWVRAARTLPGAPDVVHHVVTLVVYPEDLARLGPGATKKPPSFDKTPGRFLSIHASPLNDLDLPAGYAKKIPKGSRIFVEVHYTPNGVVRHDLTRVALSFEPHPTHQVIEIAIPNFDIDIPPFAPNHEEASELKMPIGGEIMSVMPHAHLRGKDFRFELQHASGGGREMFLSIPRYDFFLNQSYQFRTPLRFEKGSVLHCVAHYDNSAANPNNPDPGREVQWGSQTFEEMLVPFLDVSLDLPFDSAALRKYDLSYLDWSTPARTRAVYR